MADPKRVEPINKRKWIKTITRKKKDEKQINKLIRKYSKTQNNEQDENK